MPVDRAELERRAAAATKSDTSRGLNFNTLFGLVRERLGKDAAKACDPAGKGSRLDLFAYPVADYLRALAAALDGLAPGLGGPDGVLEELGRRTGGGFLGSALGRTVMSLAGRDPKRLVGAMPAAYKAAVGYGEREVEWLGDKRVRLVFRHDFLPAVFLSGVVLGAIATTSARNPRIVATEDGLDVTLDLSWE